MGRVTLAGIVLTILLPIADDVLTISLPFATKTNLTSICVARNLWLLAFAYHFLSNC